MVKKIKRGGRVIYVCEICGFGYGDMEMAKKCQEYCSTHNACSLKITSKAIYLPKPKPS